MAEVIQHSESEVLNKLNKLQVKRCFLAKIKCYIDHNVVLEE